MNSKRVVSLLPSATEIVCLVGAESMLIGRSHECDFPPGIRHLPTLTASVNQFESSMQMHLAVQQTLEKGEGLYSLDTAKLAALQPDVIVTQSLCSVCSVDLNLVERACGVMGKAPTVVSLNPLSIEDVIYECQVLGDALGTQAQAREVAQQLRQRVDKACGLAAELQSSCVQKPKVLFAEWTDPVFVGGHWTPQLIHLAGGLHPLNQPRSGSMCRDGKGAVASFTVTPEEILAMEPDWVILCPCGLNLEETWRESQFLSKQQWWQQLPAVRKGQVVAVDGNQMFNRPGPRLVDALEWLVGLLHNRPDAMPEGFPWRMWQDMEQEFGRLPTSAPVPQHQGLTVGAQVGCASKESESGQQPAWMVHPGTTATPCLPLDIEHAHLSACSYGQRHYTDPATGYMVFTSQALLERGHCCGNRCRHCPYGHCMVVSSTRQNRIVTPVLLFKKSQRPKEVVLLVWLGDSASKQAWHKLRKDGKEVLLLVAADVQSNAIWMCDQSTSLDSFQDFIRDNPSAYGAVVPVQVQHVTVEDAPDVCTYVVQTARRLCSSCGIQIHGSLAVVSDQLPICTSLATLSSVSWAELCEQGKLGDAMKLEVL